MYVPSEKTEAWMDEYYDEIINAWVNRKVDVEDEEEEPRKLNKYTLNPPTVQSLGSCGYSGLSAWGTIVDGVFSEAVQANDRVGIELLALGKPCGDIFNPEHWMYDSVRDHYSYKRHYRY